jgi:hypothetical protein
MDVRLWSTGMMFGSTLARSLRRAALPALLSLAAPVAWTQVRDCETVAAGLAEPVTLTAPLASGDEVTVQALLRRPAGDRVEGAVVVLHGFWGIRPPQCIHHNTDSLTEWGYATLLIDSPSQTTSSGVRMTNQMSQSLPDLRLRSVQKNSDDGHLSRQRGEIWKSTCMA